MVPLWLVLILALLAFAVLYLSWRLRQCKCSLLENFENGDESPEPEESKDADVTEEDTETKGVEGDEGTETKGTETKGTETKGTETKTAEIVDTSDIEPEKETKTSKKKETVSKKLADQFMNYSEMKIFNSLRDNAYSLNDIKRMIREGEINEKMIEKFLARVESMEDKTTPKKPVVEGFAPGGYASALFY